jgi:ABC-2 type transport system permease protein
MSRIVVVATSEFLALVKGKAFIIGILMMPVLIGISIAFQVFAARNGDVEDHKFVVVDRTGVLYETIAKAAADHNEKQGPADARTGPHFLPERIDPAGRSDADIKAELSDRVRKRDLFAFVEIPASVLDVTSTTADQVNYYTETPSYDTLPDWLGSTLQREVTARRFTAASVDPALVSKLTRTARVTTLGLVERKTDGTVSEAKRENPLVTFVLPFGLMYLLFIALMSSAPQLLTAVVEEKMSRISEVLIASVTPFQLMMGKLIGSGAVSVLLALIYVAGGLAFAAYYDYLSAVTPGMLAWFALFLALAVMIFGSIFVAIGAACTDLKDSQNMMMPVMLLIMLPMLTWGAVMRAPDGMMAVGLSLIPTAAPFLMMLRIALQPGPPLWQILLSVALMAAFSVLSVWAAGKIFRTGLLMQGKSATIPEMIRWVRAG